MHRLDLHSNRMLRSVLLLALLALVVRACAYVPSPLWSVPGVHFRRIGGARQDACSRALCALAASGNAAAAKGGGRASSAYIHIPFCKQRCYYCDFPISVVGADTSQPRAKSAIDRYLDSLDIELDRGGGGAMAPARPPAQDDIGTRLKTVYLGGGTPSLLEPRQVDRILRALDQRFGLEADTEISMEMDPGTFDLAKVRPLRPLSAVTPCVPSAS